MLTLQQIISYLHAHGAPNSVIQQVMDLSRRHGLNGPGFQDLLTRYHWRPRGVSWNDAVNWARHRR
ncbi:hypothetical protein [Pseudonocardia sp.]|jgi:hypothetical protein|uniref:hypothetical protein n=1 Tax=Pseudonocardia sp. TaxID=60912 RepID=UPI002624B6A1|nr:hypothetical protein [Pseudonocardia sp.]MCW2717122.1 hypothetical protein [Pseudonocardia sp.]MDT7613571.1 hypothetical protein [Pseudonocardiales bacterium]